MSDLTRFALHDPIIIPTAKAAKILALLDDCWGVTNDYSTITIKLDKGAEYHFEKFNKEKFDGILKAQVLGMTYEEYLDVERKSKESISDDKDIPS